MFVIVTIPAYNEADTIGKAVKDIRDALDDTKYSFKVMIVDDGSTDTTADIAKKAGAIVFSHPQNYGLAEAFRTELQKAVELKADVIVHIDADLQYKAKEIPLLLKEIEKGYDLVLGSRFKGTIEHMPLIKKIGNKAFSKIITRITRTPISDGQTGFRAFTREVAEKIPIISSHTYTQEQIIRAVRLKFKIKEVPVYFAKRKDKSRLISNPFSYAIRAWINIIRIYRDYEPLKFFGGMGGMVSVTGVLIGLYLVYLHFTEGIIGHFGLMMLDILTLSIGLQLIIFGFLADMLKK